MAMPAATAQQICTFALRKLGVVNRQMPVQADDMKDALDALWFVLDSLNRQGLMIPFYSAASFTVAETTRTLTIGTNGDFDVTPPLDINAIKVNSGGTLYTLQPYQGVMAFNEVSLYGDQQNYPRFYNYNPSYPAQQLTLDAMLMVGDIVTIYGLWPFEATFDIDVLEESTEAQTTPVPVQLSLTEETQFPAGYQSMLMWGVAEHLLPEYPQENGAVVQQIVKEAKASKDAIKSRNNRARSLQFSDTNRPLYWGNICDPYRWQ